MPLGSGVLTRRIPSYFLFSMPQDTLSTLCDSMQRQIEGPRRAQYAVADARELWCGRLAGGEALFERPPQRGGW
jgi:hypothetical protein